MTQYFCNLENRNFISKCMPTLISNIGETLNEQDRILLETKIFIKIYILKNQQKKINLKRLLGKWNIPILRNKKQKSLEGKISYEELLLALKRAKNNKSPGSDSFTAAFYKFFWSDIGYFLLRS